MRPFLGRVTDTIIAGEPLLLAVAIPPLIFPRGYLWQWRHGLFHYAPIEEPGLRYPGLLSWIGLGLVALPWILRWARHGRPTRPTPLDLPIAVYLATAALSLWPSVDRAHSLNFLLLIVAGVALYYGLVNAVHDLRRLQMAVALFLVGGLSLTAFGLLQADWSQPPDVVDLPVIYAWLQSLPSLSDRPLNIGITAGAALLFIPLGISLALVAERWQHRALLLPGTVLIVAFLLLTQSRGDILALALTGPALWLWLRRRGPGGLVLSLLALTGLTLYAPGPLARITGIYPGRWQVWERAACIIRDHPFTGIGLDTFRIVAQNVYPYFDYALDQTPMAHNRLLQVGVDQGLLGLLAFVALVVLFYHTNRRAWHRARTRWQKGLSLGICGSFTAFMLGSVFDDGVLTGRAGLAVWFLLGLGIAQAHWLTKKAAIFSYPETRWRWLYRRDVRPLVVPTALLLLALSAFVLQTVVWYNLGNLARNRGWLSTDLDASARAACAVNALAYYERAGDRAARDRGALIFLAHHPPEALFRLGGTPSAEDRRNVSAFLDAVAARTSPAAAVSDLQSAVTLYPGDRFAHLYLAEAQRAEGRLSHAAFEYQRAGAPVEWVVAEARRRWDWGRGDVEGAVDQLTVATLMAPHSPAAWRALADLYRDLGMVSQAEQAYLRLLQIEPDNAYAQAELTRLQGQNP